MDAPSQRENFNHPGGIGSAFHRASRNTFSILRIKFESDAENGQKGAFCKGLRTNGEDVPASKPQGSRENKFAILGVEAPGRQGAKAQEYLAYSEFSQRSQAGGIGV